MTRVERGMLLIARGVLLLLVLAVGSWALLFSLANESSVTLDLVFVRLPDVRVATLVLCAFIAGGLGGLLAGSGAIWRAVRSERALRRSLRAGTGAAPASPPPTGGKPA